MAAIVKKAYDWTPEKHALFFLLKLLFLLSSVKFLFYVFNKGLIRVTTPGAGIKMAAWSVYYDLLVILVINIPFLLLCWLCRKAAWEKTARLITVLFIMLNAFCVLLNIADIFYFHFHSQRADADLLYVLQDPLQKTLVRNPVAAIGALALCAALLFIVYRIHKAFAAGNAATTKSGGLIIVALALVFVLSVNRKKYLPTYPLTNLNSSELQVVQNSLHTFAYSVYRSREGIVRPYVFMNKAMADQLAADRYIIKPLAKKNVVLFIMESIPADYFDTAGNYKVNMPFIDSLLGHSTYYKNAFSYSHNSNKGIVAILSGLPTLTEIPLYHSNYADLEKTAVGSLLKKQNYSSLFMIGDNYDDFGFAKCCNWLGIGKYYCKDDMQGMNFRSHTMGVHDEYVLHFFQKKLSVAEEPFFSVHFNISTHYPYDLPETYRNLFKKKDQTPGMRSMHYYSECIRAFFESAKQQRWYDHTVFIFCSDHWMYPDENAPVSDVLQKFRIPVFIFDPSENKKQIVDAPVSQLDVMSTVLSYAGISDTVISYGRSLSDTLPGRIVFMRENSSLYQAVDSTYVLGYNPVNDKVEYLYDTRKDALRKHNLSAEASGNRLLASMKAFLQNASQHYNKLN